MTTYCAWLGQRLPNEAEWYLGARGPLPHIYSWGDAMPTCDQFPDAYAYVPKGDAVNCGGPPIYFAPFEVGKHPAGASPFGLLDVCVTYEVFSSAPGQALCGAPFCSVGPKAMETVSGLSADGIYDGPGVAPKWITSFRCASSAK